MLALNFTWEKVMETQCGNYRNLLSHIFGKNFVTITHLLNKLLNSWFDEIFFRWARFFRFSILLRAQCGNYKNCLSHIFGKNFVKPTHLLKKLLNNWFDEILFSWMRVIFYFSTVWITVWKNWKIFREINSIS